MIEVEEIGTGRRFAMKLQKKDKTQKQAFSECKALLRVNHPFIVRLEQAFQTGSFFVLVMELCPSDLNRVLVHEDVSPCGLPLERAARFAGQILLALLHLHETLKIVYRDMKPDNVLISQTDEAKLTDFGLAKTINTREQGPSRLTMCGTFGFMAPEVMGSLDPDKTVSLDPFKVDTYAFGVTLQLMLLGERGGEKRDVRDKGAMLLPFHGDNSEVLDNALAAGHISQDAYALLTEDLLPLDPEARRRLRDKHVREHPFFLKALNCNCLEEVLILS